jgi:hypothetical protein
LPGALDNSNSEGGKPKDGDVTMPLDADNAGKSRPRDYQLDRALDLIRGVAMFSGIGAVSK